MPETTVKHLANQPINLDVLRAFEQGLNPQNLKDSSLQAQVLGYGEISTVFAIDHPEMAGLAFKRLPIFLNWDEVQAYTTAYETYIQKLTEAIGIPMPAQGYAAIENRDGRPIFYIVQAQEDAEAIGHKAIHTLPTAEVERLLLALLRHIRQIWDYNQQQDRLVFAIDGQISNWVILGFDSSLPAEPAFLYLDTSTPLYKENGILQLNPELFLRSAPSFLRWVLRLFFLDDVIARYFDFHLVTVDIIAQFYKEGLPEQIPALVQAANRFFTGEAADLNVAPLSEKEVKAYYQEDAFIWSLYLALRRLDRFLHGFLRRPYPYILPGKIKR